MSAMVVMGATGVDKGALGAQASPQWPGKKEFFLVKIEGLSTMKLGPRPPSS